MAKSNLDYIIEALDAGLDLQTFDERGGVRKFVKGQITREKNARGSVRTTHVSASLGGYIWLTKSGIVSLTRQAKEKLARKNELLAAKAAAVRAAMDM